MRLLFYFGIALLGLAFAAAAAETVSHAMPGSDRGFIVPARDLWYTLWPGSLLIAEIRVERVAPWLWDPVLVTILKLPGWAVLGIPGGLIAWFTRPHRGSVDEDQINEVLASFELYDELTREAQKVNDPGDEHGPQDMHPEESIEADDDSDPYKLPPRRNDAEN
ncbi:MAG: hypothetical protein ACTSV1_00010 [Alphaproteobacteria bacterium]